MMSVEELAAKHINRNEVALRRACSTLGINVRVRTPVDTGELRKSWTPSVNALNSSNSGGDIDAVASTMKVGDTFSLINAQPYAGVIEYLGHSDQAPQGMLRISVAEWPAIVRRSYAN